MSCYIDASSLLWTFYQSYQSLFWVAVGWTCFLQLNLNLVDFTKCMNFIRLNFRLAEKDCLKVSFLRPKHLPVAIMISWFRYQIYQINHIVQESTSDWNQLQSLANGRFAWEQNVYQMWRELLGWSRSNQFVIYLFSVLVWYWPFSLGPYYRMGRV